MSAHDFPKDIRKVKARVGRDWGAKGEPCPTEEWAPQQAKELQDEAEQQYWEEIPLIDALRTTAFQLWRALSDLPVNLDRHLALVERQEQNTVNYEGWVATHQRIKKEADWYTAVSVQGWLYSRQRSRDKMQRSRFSREMA